MPPVARTYAEVYPVAPQFGQRLTRQLSPGVDKAAEETSKHFGRKFAAGLAVGAGIIGVGLYKATKLATRGILVTTKAASALNEQTNKSNAIFGRNAKEIQRWATGAAKGFGQSRTEALTSAAAFGDMFLQLKIGQRPAVDMSKRMVELASDLASFSDADITQVLQAQQAAFRGEYDSLQRFIPNINAARVQQVALNQTHKSSVKDLTAAEKAQATYTIMVQDSKRAAGDYANTLKTSVANQNRQAKAQWEDLKVTLGQGFLPAQLAVTRAFTEKLLPAAQVFVRELAPGIKATATALAEGLTSAIPPAGELADMARNLGDRLQELGPGLGQRLGEGLGKLFDLLKQIGPELRNTNVQTSDLAPTLRLSGALFGFIADNADVLARHIPLLVAGFLAYKTAQAAANVAAAADIALMPARIVATLSLAQANRTLAASLGGRATATEGVVAAEGQLAAASLATGVQTTGLLARLGALIPRLAVWTAGIYAVVTAYRALTGETVHMTRETHTTADAVERYGAAAGLAVAGVKGLKDETVQATAATRLAMTAAERHTSALTLERQAVSALHDALRGEQSAELEVRQAKLNVATAQERLTGLTRDGRKGSLDYKQAQIDLRRAQIDLKARTEEYKGAQIRANDTQRDARRAALQAQGPYQTFGDKAQTAGRKAFVMGQQAREGINLIPRSRVSSITAKFGWQGLEVFRSPGTHGRGMFAEGGPVWGAGTTSSDSIAARLSHQEHVWEAPAVRGLGGGSYRRGHQRLIEMRAQARGYAAGGPVLSAHIPDGTQLHAPILRFQANIERVLDLATARFKKLAERLGGPGGIGGATGPGGWQWQMRTLRQRFPGLPLISGFRPGAITATGNRSYHGFGRAVDVPPRMDIFNWIRSVYGRNTKELIYSPAGNRQIHNGQNHMYTGITRAMHFNHVHWAYRQGGPVQVPHRIMDRGGVLPPRSTTLVSNRTTRPEPVGLDYDALAEAMAHVKVPIYLDRIKVSHELGPGVLWNDRRR